MKMLVNEIKLWSLVFALHFISAKILPYLNDKHWIQHWSEYQERWESWTVEQQIIKSNCSVLTWTGRAEILFVKALFELLWSWATVDVTFPIQLISSCICTVCRSFAFILSSSEKNAIRLQNILRFNPFIVADFSPPHFLVHLCIWCWKKPPTRCMDSW